MSDSKDIQKAKIDSLVTYFTSSGYKSNTKLGQSEFIICLNKRSSSGKFDQDLSTKLFQVLSLDASSQITIEEFINGFLVFEEDIRKNAEILNIRYNKELQIYNQLLQEFKLYKENLNEEGLCENAKIYGQITEIDIKRKLEGIKEIIIKVVYNEKTEELHFKIGDINNSAEMSNKTFEFKPESRKDKFEFIMKGLNDRNQIFDIGSKVFPLNEVYSYEEYKVQIIVPEIENEEQIAAYINAKLILYWNDCKEYEQQIKKAESKLNKLRKALNKAEYYINIIREIYGDLNRKKPDLIVDFNNEKLMQRKGAKINVDFNNEKKAFTTGNYVVEFNNKKDVIIQKKDLKIEFKEIKQEKKVVEKEEKEIKEEIKKEKEESKEEEKPKEEEKSKEEIPTVIENPPGAVENIDTNNIITENVDITNTGYEQGLEATFNQEGYQNFNETENKNDYNSTEQLNFEGDINVNYNEYQTTPEENYENITELQNTEIVNETEFRNSVQEAVIRQSMRDPLYTSNVLPVKILEEKVNKINVDSNVTYLPLIYGGKKVTHVNAEESTNYNFNQDYSQNIQGQDYNNEIVQGQEEYNTQNIQGQEELYGNIQNEDYNNQVIQGQEDLTYGEYQATSYN